MRKQTDLNSVKSLASIFLEMDIKETPHSPAIVQHPFTTSAHTKLCNSSENKGLINLLEDEAGLSEWKAAIRHKINQMDTPRKIFYLVTKPYLMAFLKYSQDYLNQKDFSEILAYIWVNVESPNLDQNFSYREKLNLFSQADPTILMTPEEYDYLQNLDELVTVYRGVTDYNEKNNNALSWTLNKDQAIWFSRRFGESGTVYEAQVRKYHILALFSCRGEMEVIIDPKNLIGLTICKNI